MLYWFDKGIGAKHPRRLGCNFSVTTLVLIVAEKLNG
jgi:hypothetical protein